MRSFEYLKGFLVGSYKTLIIIVSVFFPEINETIPNICHVQVIVSLINSPGRLCKDVKHFKKDVCCFDLFMYTRKYWSKFILLKV